ncbi:MAG TPA: CARDB domain-containing protein [Tahibacter sp.]|nr:CARDB domain-containing protein [Tahibacter sp.]
MNAKFFLSGMFSCVFALGCAQAQTAPEYAYFVRLKNTTAGTTAGKSATLTGADGLFVYTNVALVPRNCPSTSNPTALRGPATVNPVGTTAAPRRVELRLQTNIGRGCLLVGAFDLHIDDDPPIMPDPGPPGQIAAFVVPPADLDVFAGFEIGSSGADWGTSVAVPSSDAVKTSGGSCTFNYAYAIKNYGVAASKATENTLRIGGPNSPIASEDEIPGLDPGAFSIVNGKISLPPGLSTLTLDIDAPDIVDESVEANQRQIDVNVTGSCN